MGKPIITMQTGGLVLTNICPANNQRYILSCWAKEHYYRSSAGRNVFLTFCSQAAHIGVEKWVTNTLKMMCTYYDIAGNEMIAEPIPQIG